MKDLLKGIGASGLLCLLFTLPAAAQITNGLNFTTTFPFYVGNTKLPAGSYKVTSSTYDSLILQIDSATGNHSAFIEFTAMQSGNPHAATDVGFKKYGTMDFLDTMWIAGQQYGMQVDPSKVEQKLAAGAKAQAHSVPGKGN